MADGRSVSRKRGGLNQPRVDRTGEHHRGLVVIGQGERVGNELTWSCQCATCGRVFSVPSRRFSAKANKGEGCGCREALNVEKAIAARRKVAA